MREALNLYVADRNRDLVAFLLFRGSFLFFIAHSNLMVNALSGKIVETMIGSCSGILLE